MALGAAQFFPLAGLASYQEILGRSWLSVADAEVREAAPLPWWRRVALSQQREAQHVRTELMATRDVMPLLMKARNGGHWTPDERHELLAHLRRMAHLSPYLILLLLPGSILILPAYAWWLDRRRLKRPD